MPPGRSVKRIFLISELSYRATRTISGMRITWSRAQAYKDYRPFDRENAKTLTHPRRG